jgi:peptidoglycan hydrolase-like protein with peptidoglycan-binding domain
VNRRLSVTSPLAHGPDVHALQEALKAELEHNRIDWLPVNPDGDLGPQTLHAARFFSWVLGLGGRHRKRLKAGILPKATQELLRNPEKRSRIERLRAKRRQPRLRKIRKAQSEGPAAAVAYARSFVGTTESPSGSNSGPTHTNGKGQPGGVTFWESYWGLGPCFWCLCFASYCIKAIGGAKIAGNCCFSVAIEGYARNHENGWVQVPIAEARPGDISIWKFNGPSSPSDHGELVVEHGVSEDVGGNTSADDGGSQSNGGGVFPKHRDLSQCSMVARPLYS